MSLVAAGGAVQFKSNYDVHLFAELPTLQKLDPDKAKRLLTESTDVSTFVAKYPQGLNSLAESGMTGFMSAPSGTSSEASMQPMILEQQRMEAIIKDAADHPNDALANAALLSPSYAASAYLAIAGANAKKNSAVAESALGKTLDLLPHITASDRMRYILQIVYAYENLGEKDRALKAVELGTKTAAELYKQESTGDDPNVAPEAYWVSTNAIRSLVDASYKIDPMHALTILKAAPDDEIRVFAQIALARRLMGGEGTTMDITISTNKSGTSINTTIVN